MDVLTGLPLVKKRCRSWLFLWQVSSHSPTHTMLSWSLVVSSLVRKQIWLCIPQMLPTSIFPPASCSQSPQGSRHLVNWIFSVSPGAEAVLVAGGVGRASWCPTQKASLVAARSTRQSSTLLQPSVWRQRSHWSRIPSWVITLRKQERWERQGGRNRQHVARAWSNPTDGNIGCRCHSA